MPVLKTGGAPRYPQNNVAGQGLGRHEVMVVFRSIWGCISSGSSSSSRPGTCQGKGGAHTSGDTGARAEDRRGGGSGRTGEIDLV